MSPLDIDPMTGESRPVTLLESSLRRPISTWATPHPRPVAHLRRCSVAINVSPEIVEVRRSQAAVKNEKQAWSPGPERNTPKSYNEKEKPPKSRKEHHTEKPLEKILATSEWYPSSAMIDPRLTKEQAFLLVFGRALMTYGCPLPQVEPRVIEMAQVVEVNVEVIRLPTAMLLIFFDRSVELTPRRTARQHYLKVGGALDLGKLREVQEATDLVKKGYSNAQAATERLLQIGVRLRGGKWSTGLTQQVERFRFSLQQKLMRRPKPILAMKRTQWENALKDTRESTRNSKFIKSAGPKYL